MTAPWTTVWSSSPATAGWWPVLDSFVTISLTVTPSITVVIHNPHETFTVAKTITPVLSVAANRAFHTSVAETITPNVSPVIHLHPAIVSEGLTVTPTFGAAASKTIHAAVALIVTPTLHASEGVIGSVALTQTPSINSTIHLHPGLIHDSLTVTPTLSAAAAKTIHGSILLSVTPTISTAASRTAHGSAALSVTPTISASARIVKRSRQINVSVQRAATI